MTLAILCSGQGPQHPEMFALTRDVPAAAPLFDRARDLLGGVDPRDLVCSDRDLHGNRTGQILCMLQPLAAKAMLADLLPRRRIVAGYSIGEVAGWCLAGMIEPSETLDLAARRAEAMDASNPPEGGLLFVRGLERSAIDELCAAHRLAVAIVNPGDAVVIGGLGPDLDDAARAAAARGALRVSRLAVAVASHTPRLGAASVTFRDILAQASVASRVPPGVRLLSGIDAAPVFRVAEGLDKLAAQISQTVRWADCLSACVEAGATTVLELGPGRALAEMAASVSPALASRSIDDFRTRDGLLEWLARQAGRAS